MKILLSISIFIYALKSYGQITITKNDLPNAGDNISYSNASVQGFNFNPKKTGANQTWNYSNLKPTSQGVYNYVTSLSTPYLAYFFNTIGIKTQDTLNLGIIKFSDIYDFYKKTDSKFSIVGRGFSYSGLPLPASFEIEDKIYNFPLKFGDKDSTPFYFKLTDPTGTLPFRYAQTGWRVTNVDGWGNITTPYGSFDCIRVKTKLMTTDTITLLGFSVPIRRTSYEYRWLTNGEKIPILQINGNETFGNFTVTQVIYRDIQRPLKPIADFNYTDTRGEPGYEITFNDISKNNPTEWIWNVTPNTVKYMWGTNPGSQSVNIRFDSVGVYDVSLRASNKGGYSDMVKTGLIEIHKPVPSGLATMSDEQFKIFPNPAQKELFVELPPTSVQGQIEIYSLSGQLVMSSVLKPEQNQINIEHLAKGTFVVKIKQGQFQNYRFFVKE